MMSLFLCNRDTWDQSIPTRTPGIAEKPKITLDCSKLYKIGKGKLHISPPYFHPYAMRSLPSDYIPKVNRLVELGLLVVPRQLMSRALPKSHTPQTFWSIFRVRFQGRCQTQSKKKSLALALAWFTFNPTAT